jgi:hypothetical protein
MIAVAFTLKYGYMAKYLEITKYAIYMFEFYYCLLQNKKNTCF